MALWLNSAFWNFKFGLSVFYYSAFRIKPYGPTSNYLAARLTASVTSKEHEKNELKFDHGEFQLWEQSSKIWKNLKNIKIACKSYVLYEYDYGTPVLELSKKGSLNLSVVEKMPRGFYRPFT